ncbi:globin domain-containing protein [Ekhidna sp. To15]|uniref:globin domain-containing protein n=1 Tax=Ekhidna sp. To15 TaxID=3395267 RepID=UPI003F523A5D
MTKFYDHLFDIAPETIHYFPDDISKQSDKLAHTMNFVVSNLTRLEDIKNTIEELGRFHNRLDIEPEHYLKLSTALVRTIKENMGDRYKDEIGEAWNKVLEYLSQVMLNARTKKRKNIIANLITLFKSSY